jgi:purine/pyrimidine-nucleoside phosphorylase
VGYNKSEKEMKQFNEVSVLKKANVYFDGKCVSRLVLFPDGSRATLGVIFPSTLNFDAKRRETMEIVAGECRVRHAGSDDWATYLAGERFVVLENSSFEIEVREIMEYVCHYH